MFSVRQLYDLQLLDWGIQEREQELAEARDRLADDSKRIAAKNRLESLETRLDELRGPRRQAESAIEQLDQRLGTIETRVYSGQITNPRELTAYEEEKAVVQRQRASQEDSLLTVLVEIETLQGDLLDTAAGLVGDGGRIIYATCSLLRSENEDQVAAFLDRNEGGFRVVPVGDVWRETIGGACPAAAGEFLRLTPRRHGTDGFFAAILERVE